MVFERLVDYQLPLREPLFRRRLVTLDLIHDEAGRQFPVDASEIISVERLNNRNLRIAVMPDDEGFSRTGYIDADAPWEIECYSPEGDLIQTLTNEE